MSQLDHYSLSRQLGSTFVPYTRHAFGGTGIAAGANQFLSHRPLGTARLSNDPKIDKMIVEAFGAVHKGLSIDRVLADPAMNASFVAACIGKGIIASPTAINRRLLRIRKNGSRVVRIPRTKRETRSDSSRWLVAAELAFTRMSYQYDISADDILTDPEIGARFDIMAGEITPGGSPTDYRLAALYLRKNVRTYADLGSPHLEGFNFTVLRDHWRHRGTLSETTPDAIEDGEALIRIYEASRELFISRHESARYAYEQFYSGRAFKPWTNRFWSPDPRSIRVDVLPRTDIIPPLHYVELKAIQVHAPIFNMRLAA